MTPEQLIERVKSLGVVWHHAASKLEDAARAAETARLESQTGLDLLRAVVAERAPAPLRPDPLVQEALDLSDLSDPDGSWGHGEALEEIAGVVSERHPDESDKVSALQRVLALAYTSLSETSWRHAEVEAMADAREKQGEPAQYACDFCRDGQRFMTAVDAVNADGSVVNPRPAPCLACKRTERAAPEPPARVVEVPR